MPPKNPAASSSDEVIPSEPEDNEMMDASPSEASEESDNEREYDPNYKKKALVVEEVDIMEVYEKLPKMPLWEGDASQLELKCDNPRAYNKQELDPQRRNTDGWGMRQDVSKRKERQKIIASILQRWWFVFPMWPPRNFDWEGELRKRNYRLVEVESFKQEEDVEDGYAKVWPLKMYPGLFRDAKGKLIDMRPKQTCPCYANLNMQPLDKLIDFLCRAYENQLRVLKEHQTFESDKRQKITLESLNDMRRRKTELIKKSSSQAAKTAFGQALKTMRQM